ncbi:hypothetical protein [Neisseria mucosa]|jgi:hypothetical protein|nr:hypothetical protein [Neisseria mucosa]
MGCSLKKRGNNPQGDVSPYGLKAVYPPNVWINGVADTPEYGMMLLC